MVTLETNIMLFKSTILQLESKTFLLYVLKSQKENTLKELYTMSKWDLSLECEHGSTYAS